MSPCISIDSIVGPFRSIEGLRHSYRPGCSPHWIQAKRAWEHGRWAVGVLEEVEGWELRIRRNERMRLLRLGTLWTDRLAQRLEEGCRRDGLGRPIVRYSSRWHYLELLPVPGDDGYPAFNVVDLHRHPEALSEWQRLAEGQPPGARTATRQ